MAASRTIVRAIWDGPFKIGELRQPVSVGDVLLKIFETLWRAIICIFTLVLVLGAGLGLWLLVIEPTFFPPAKDVVRTTSWFDDGEGVLPPVTRSVRSGETCPPRATAAETASLQRRYPIQVQFWNDGNKPVTDLSFSLEGRLPGRSTNEVIGGSWLKYDGIIPPERGMVSCFAASVREGVNPRVLDYEAAVWKATYQ